MKRIAAIGICLLLAWSCNDPPPKSDPQMASILSTEKDVDGFVQRIGHVVLQVSDLKRSTEFYREVMNLDLHEEAMFKGRKRAFLSATDEHHEVVLLETDSPRDIPKESRWVQQVAFEVGSREELVSYYEKLKKENIAFELKNNQIAWSLYFDDPDDIKIEVYWDIRDEPFGEQMWEGDQTDLSPKKLINPTK